MNLCLRGYSNLTFATYRSYPEYFLFDLIEGIWIAIFL